MTRKKISPGHYEYSGYQIIRSDRKIAGRFVWVITPPLLFSMNGDKPKPMALQKRLTLQGCITMINRNRFSVWTMVHAIMKERYESS